jgi:hypothetical protein
MDFCESFKGLVVVFDACIKKIAFLGMRSILQIVPEGLFDSAKQATDPLLDNLIFCYVFVIFIFYGLDFVISKIAVKTNKHKKRKKNMTKPTPDMTAIPFDTSVLYFCGRDNKMIYQSIVEKTQVPGIVAQMRGFGYIVYAGDQLYPEAVYYYGLPKGGFKVTVHSVSDSQWNLKPGRSNTRCEFVVREKGILDEAKLREVLDERRRSLGQVELWDYYIVPVPDGTRADFTLGDIFSAVCFSNIN